MASPYTSKYDTSPLTGDNDQSDGDKTDEDSGKDLSYLVPQVSVAWENPPSFNLPPRDPGGSGGTSKDVAQSGPFLMDGPSVRGAEQSMLGGLRTSSAAYSSLRGKVLATEYEMFGPKEKAQPLAAMNSTTPGNSSGGTSNMPDGDTDPEGQAQLTEMAQHFYASMKPAMEKALWQIANSLELSGQFLAMVNRAGQTYAQMDRACVFPEPPASSVVH
ncbi:hypothetical protein [Streptomyces sp. SID11385]|uniref:hypothetical protein n=1 Tax=Streptomyces sp. SID11385 TaxID=2706031 RepID=UPI0013C6887E|nr:hypothetical protein [Streptomyces sp. SID11385]NEA41776.1 hypothetical protein [Streptomyces sp. SID11385]